MISKKTKHLFDNVKYRSQLIDMIKQGKIVIDENVCECIYEVVKPTRTGETKKTLLNMDEKARGLPCSYDTTLHNLGYKLNYLGSGTYGFAGSVCKNDDEKCDYGYAIKLLIYDNDPLYGSFDNPNRPENIEVTILKLLNQQILLTNISPHITLYIQDFVCRGVPVLWEDGKNESFDEYIEKVDEPVSNASAIVMISELAKYGSLYSLITKHGKTFGIDIIDNIYFQFVYTFAQIQKTIPGFRHNDCHCGNILIQHDENFKADAPPKYYIYAYPVSSSTSSPQYKFYRVPVIPYQMKLWDFDFANIEGVTKNAKNTSFKPKDFGWRLTRNDYYDLHIFTNDSMMYIMTDDVKTSALPKIRDDKKFMRFLTSIVPRKYFGKKTINTDFGRLIPDDKYTSPHEILVSERDSKFFYLNDKYGIDIENINMDDVVDCFGIDISELKNMIMEMKYNSPREAKTGPPEVKTEVKTRTQPKTEYQLFEDEIGYLFGEVQKVKSLKETHDKVDKMLQLVKTHNGIVMSSKNKELFENIKKTFQDIITRNNYADLKEIYEDVFGEMSPQKTLHVEKKNIPTTKTIVRFKVDVFNFDNRSRIKPEEMTQRMTSDIEKWYNTNIIDIKKHHNFDDESENILVTHDKDEYFLLTIATHRLMSDKDYAEITLKVISKNRDAEDPIKLGDGYYLILAKHDKIISKKNRKQPEKNTSEDQKEPIIPLNKIIKKFRVDVFNFNDGSRLKPQLITQKMTNDIEKWYLKHIVNIKNIYNFKKSENITINHDKDGYFILTIATQRLLSDDDFMEIALMVIDPDTGMNDPINLNNEKYLIVGKFDKTDIKPQLIKGKQQDDMKRKQQQEQEEKKRKQQQEQEDMKRKQQQEQEEKKRKQQQEQQEEKKRKQQQEQEDMKRKQQQEQEEKKRKQQQEQDDMKRKQQQEQEDMKRKQQQEQEEMRKQEQKGMPLNKIVKKFKVNMHNSGDWSPLEPQDVKMMGGIIEKWYLKHIDEIKKIYNFDESENINVTHYKDDMFLLTIATHRLLGDDDFMEIALMTIDPDDDVNDPILFKGKPYNIVGTELKSVKKEESKKLDQEESKKLDQKDVKTTSNCVIPKNKKTYPNGICKNKNHVPCPPNSKWCSYCLTDGKMCQARNLTRSKGSYSYKSEAPVGKKEEKKKTEKKTEERKESKHVDKVKDKVKDRLECNKKNEKSKDPKYVCNPETGRWVKRDGKIGKQMR
jgi:hypothetical protein